MNAVAQVVRCAVHQQNAGTWNGMQGEIADHRPHLVVEESGCSYGGIEGPNLVIWSGQILSPVLQLKRDA